MQVACGASVLAAVGGKDVQWLPSASTCFNTLKLYDTFPLSFCRLYDFRDCRLCTPHKYWTVTI